MDAKNHELFGFVQEYSFGSHNKIKVTKFGRAFGIKSSQIEK